MNITRLIIIATIWIITGCAPGNYSTEFPCHEYLKHTQDRDLMEVLIKVHVIPMCRDSFSYNKMLEKACVCHEIGVMQQKLAVELKDTPGIKARK